MTAPGKSLIVCFVLSIFSFVVATGPAGATDRVVADLSTDTIAISTGFDGTDLLLFGAIDGSGDIVLVVRGPEEPHSVRQKVRVAGIWANGPEQIFPDAPVFYRVASTRPLEDIAPAEILDRLQIGLDHLSLKPEEGPAPEYRAALIRNKQNLSLYSQGEGDVQVAEKRLFRSSVFFPANVPVGEYTVAVYFFQNGRLTGQVDRALEVGKVGLEAQVYEFAHDRGALYGIIAIAIAVFAGWAAGVMFRRG